MPGVGDSYVVTTATYTMDQCTIFTGSEPLEGGAIRYWNYRTSDILLKKSFTKTYDGLYATSIANINKTYQLSTSLLKTLISFSSDIILRPSYDPLIPSTSVIDALVWSYAEILDAVWRQMDTMSVAMKLEHAQGTDLDVAWGQIFDLPRFKTEDDTQYRDRLKTRTTILNCSGTEANCRTIINSIIEEDATTITTHYPATVDITFNNDNAIRIARDKIDTLNLLVPQMLAVGTNYNIFLPIFDYTADIVMNGPIWFPINMFYGLKKRNSDATYTSELTSILDNSVDLDDVDVVVSKTILKPLLMGSMVRNANIASIDMNNGLFKTCNKGMSFDYIGKKFNALATFFVDGYYQKYNVEKSFTIDAIEQALKRRMYRTELTSVFQKTYGYDFDIISRLLTSTIDMDILNKRGFPKKCAMRLTLVGA